jgi:beta-glucosidase
MLKKISALLMFFTASIFALPVVPTAVDSVVVPVTVIAGSGTNWTGKVNYWFKTGDNDSLNISLAINAVGTAPACNITKTEGDVGIIRWANGMNGKREIFFTCTFATAPTSADFYTAMVTIVANMSANETKARAMLAAIPSNAEKLLMITGDGYFNTRDANGGTYGTIKAFKMIDGPHGVNIWRQGSTTAFPCECASACAFDTALSYKIGKVICNEARPVADGRNVNLGPMVNMVRDPRGGRDFETWGEDPYLMAKLACSDVRGRQSEGVIATPKHFVCNDQERDRNFSTSNVGDTTLRQTYAYPFEMVVRQSSPWAIMAAYNKVNTVYCTENKKLLIDILKNEWGFRGIVMTDWGTQMGPNGATNGTDIEMDQAIIFGNIAVGSGGVTQDILDDKILRVLRTKIWTGCESDFGLATHPITLCIAEHQQIAYEAAQKSIVLVKNDPVASNNNQPLLPLDKNTITKVAVVGPYADQLLTGPAGPVTSSYVIPCVNDRWSALAGITAKITAAKVTTDWTQADIVIVVVSLPTVGTLAANENYDKPDATLPVSQDMPGNPSVNQNALIKQILDAGKKTIVVLQGGAGVVKDSWYDAPAVVVAFFAGQRMGMALADILFGDVNPSAKLSVTFPQAQADLPVFTNDQFFINYEKPDEGRGYPYYLKAGKTPLLWFGWGLSYTTFAYSNLVVPRCAAIGAKVYVTVDVQNTGTKTGDEIVQLYLKQLSPAAARPIKQLRGFARVNLTAAQTKTVTFELREWDFAHWSSAQGWIVDPNSTYEISVGKYSNDPAAFKGTITLDPAGATCP